ncbi:thiol:disulfide interchange protein DsbA/DsbL [Colwellia sp. TT2012]|uniref:thiol:disulfide interchange protein DsbA/DsbL n=1 Tax=Colwellia sp. TT2012 TaxID=1720342 RepID=UPI00070967BE|nr:thiol:disulfide interchange protein DsbA/DsbL [Colwellia sp. TT2012]
MHRKILLSIFIFISFNYTSQAVEFTKGDYYIEIEGSLTEKKEITEFFSFYCPGCFKQESFMNELKLSLPASAEFKKNHVDGMPGRNIKIEQALTKALVTADILKVKEKIIPAIFKYIHISKAKFNNDKDIKNLFLINGVDGDKFDKTFNSFSVNIQSQKMQKKTEALRKQGFSSVPTLIINGKYKPVTDKIKSMDEYKKLITYLLNKAA